VVATGHQQIQSIAIQTEVLEEGAEMVSDLVLAAVNAALDQSRDLATQQMASSPPASTSPRSPLT